MATGYNMLWRFWEKDPVLSASGSLEGFLLRFVAFGQASSSRKCMLNKLWTSTPWLGQGKTKQQFEFGSVWVWVNLGQFEFGSVWVWVSLGQFEFGSVWVWVSLSLGQFRSAWVWASLSLGQFEFGPVWVWASLGLGQFGSVWTGY